jgi:predicted transcriptional regulator YheO
MIVDAHKKSMERYRKLEAFFKRGEFYGLSEEVHLHVLPSENAFVVNLFNLSNEPRLIGSTVRVAELGIDPNCWYRNTRGSTFNPDTGCFTIERRLEAWSAQVAKVAALR